MGFFQVRAHLLLVLVGGAQLLDGLARVVDPARGGGVSIRRPLVGQSEGRGKGRARQRGQGARHGRERVPMDRDRLRWPREGSDGSRPAEMAEREFRWIETG